MAGVERIVVGVDGSESSRVALRWAYEEAAHHGASLTVLAAWHTPTLPMSPPGAALEEGYETLPKRSALAMLDELVADLEERTPAVDVRTSIEEGSPAEVLIERSKECDLLAVGSRGHGGFAGMLLGSVSHHLVAHAHCAVVVVR
ncbi:MAG: Universal stress protein family [uncultured Nocardioidaceae bacterium]|uniref:Universal stress protein family n=1 Tax=uncultured Nocardioidaceae bacterium TaxID=253824 RepID=A0A6J4M830_9ACTN|nr:MAG: Universal stress protein family [uncultured Nocardioidaceae bacterium]